MDAKDGRLSGRKEGSLSRRGITRGRKKGGLSKKKRFRKEGREERKKGDGWVRNHRGTWNGRTKNGRERRTRESGRKGGKRIKNKGKG